MGTTALFAVIHGFTVRAQSHKEKASRLTALYEGGVGFYYL